MLSFYIHYEQALAEIDNKLSIKLHLLLILILITFTFGQSTYANCHMQINSEIYVVMFLKKYNWLYSHRMTYSGTPEIPEY